MWNRTSPVVLLRFYVSDSVKLATWRFRSWISPTSFLETLVDSDLYLAAEDMHETT